MLTASFHTILYKINFTGRPQSVCWQSGAMPSKPDRPEIYPSVVCNCETCFISNVVNCRVVSFCDSLQHFSALTGHIKHCLRDQLFKYTLLASSRSRQKYFCFSPEKGCCGRLVCSSVNVGLDCLKNVIIVWLFTTVNGEQSLLWSSVS